MNKTFLILLTLLISSISYGQKVKLKKGSVLLDDTEVMKYEREDWGMQKIHLLALSDSTEHILMIKNDNETSGYYDDDFIQIKFLQLGEMVEMKSSKSWKGLIEWLIKQKVISKSGEILEENIPLFIKNYDENITNRTIRD